MSELACPPKEGVIQTKKENKMKTKPNNQTKSLKHHNVHFRMLVFLILNVLFFNLLTAQESSITNITVAQRTDGSRLVDVCYDLTGDENFSVFTITAEVSYDGGETYQSITMLIGDIGGDIAESAGKCFVWDFGTEAGELYTANAKIRLTANSEELPPGPGEFEMVYIPGGTYEMGCTPDGDGDCSSNEYPRHTVTLSPFSISAMEITNQQYADYLTLALSEGIITATSSSVTGDWNGSSYEYLDLDDSDCEITYASGAFTVDTGKENHPVIEVSWYSATGFASYYGGRLPTEAEWEYVARGGGQETKYSGTSNESELPDYAWYSSNNSPYGTKEVGTKLPNALGLYDMSGNVWEWVSDWYDSSYYSSSPENDPQGSDSGSDRVVRGGDWYLNANYLRCSKRGGGDPYYADGGFGFRFVSTN